MDVKAWIEKVTIPTYGTGEPEKNPMFLEKRVYQGSSGVVYPHPVIEKINDHKEDREYTAVFLENEYLLIMILPELGGRIQRAFDKVQKRDFVYYNQVVKPALVGLAGPWISGGIEFNWPQHHRPSTFSPVDFTIEEAEDGSRTVWVNETEIMFRTKGMAGFTLYPGKAYLEIKGRLFNRSPFAQTFLWWANPAVKVNEHYQSVFPPDVYAVFDHGKRDVSDFPIATGTYYKVDYSPGTDISRYSTIPVPTSYMAIRSSYDFMGCYEHDTEAGMLHVADHHLSPGKKQWTWGNGDFGYAWDRNLTDEDGPYIELMTGVFTDNQPDFSWLFPNEGKSFEQYFMPYAKVGAVKNATREAMINMEAKGTCIALKVYATEVFENAKIQCFHNGNLVNEFVNTISPREIFQETIDAGQVIRLEEWKLRVADANDHELVSWQPSAPAENTIPDPAVAAKAPSEIETIEELYLNGLHLEQYRHATFNPVDYYTEALRRSPGDIRCNNAMGLLLLRRGCFTEAEPYFRKAIATLTLRNPNPADGEPYYHLGWSLLLQGKAEEAYESFYKATWNDAWQHSAFQALARISAGKKQYSLALAHIEKSLTRNYHSPTARHLKTSLLRKLGNKALALALIDDSVRIDRFNYGCLFEQYLLLKEVNSSQADTTLGKLKLLMRGEANNYFELALDYAHAGMYEEAKEVIGIYIKEGAAVSALAYYYLGWLSVKQGKDDEAAEYLKKARDSKFGYCFPNKIEEILILQSATEINPTDARANYALGNLWYDKRQYNKAISCWEKSVTADPAFPTAYRNLSLAYYNKQKDPARAIASMEKAFDLNKADSRVLMELDQLYKVTGKPAATRLAFLDEHVSLVNERDDLYLERITILNTLGRYEEARLLLAARKFHPWEGGEGKTVGQYLLSHIELAKLALLEKDFDTAIGILTAARTFPDNLGEGKLYGAAENDIHFLLGCAMEGKGDLKKANEFFTEATKGPSEPVQAIYYNDPQPDKIVYQALAWRKLGNEKKADEIFKRFIAFGRDHYNDEIKIDYFAVSLPDMLVFDIDLNRRNENHCLYLQGLGYLGIGEIDKGVELLNQLVVRDGNHQGALTYLAMLPFFRHEAKMQLQTNG